MAHLTWYVLSCYARREKAAALELRKIGYEPYLPLISLRRRRLGVWSDVVEPLFPPYLFLGFREGVQSIAPARSTRGVHSFVRIGPRYADVSNEVIEQIREREAQGRDGRIEDPSRQFALGERIQICEGRFTGLAGVLGGIYDERDGRKRASILLDLLGSKRISVPVDSIAKIGGA